MAIYVPVDTESAGYREWTCTIEGQQYCIVCEETQWTLMHYEGGHWQETAASAESFLLTHNLLLGD